MAHAHRFAIVRRADHTKVDTAVDYIAAIARCRQLAKENKRSYAVAYIASLSPIVTSTPRGDLHWH